MDTQIRKRKEKCTSKNLQNNTVNILKTSELYTLNKWKLWLLNYILMKLFFKKSARTGIISRVVKINQHIAILKERTSNFHWSYRITSNKSHFYISCNKNRQTTTYKQNKKAKRYCQNTKRKQSVNSYFEYCFNFTVFTTRRLCSVRLLCFHKYNNHIRKILPN